MADESVSSRKLHYKSSAFKHAEDLWVIGRWHASPDRLAIPLIPGTAGQPRGAIGQMGP